MKSRTLVWKLLDGEIVRSPVAADLKENIDTLLPILLADGWKVVASGGAGAGGGEFRPTNLRGWENYYGFITLVQAPRG
jgi:hypothetical protein